MATRVKTYAARKRPLPPSPRTSSPPPETTTRKRKLPSDIPAPERAKPKPKLTQLHLAFGNSTQKTCSLCELRYTRGAEDDEALHRTHCARVQRGLEWGRDDEKDATRIGLRVVDDVVKVGKGKTGRIICVDAHHTTGKIGAKLSALMDTINLALSAPAMSPPALRRTKAYIFLLPGVGANSREQIAGCVLAQHITHAMLVLPHEAQNTTLVGGVACDPKPLPTALGIARIFVPKSYRRRGIAMKLLDAAARTAVHGCVLDARHGQVAFSQPTGTGQALMNAWGVTRVYEEEDE